MAITIENNALTVQPGATPKTPTTPGSGASFQQALEGVGNNTPGILTANGSNVIMVANSQMSAQAGARREVAAGASGQTAFGAGAMTLPNGGMGAMGGVGTVGGVGGAGQMGAVGQAAGGDGQSQLLDATRQMQETQMSFNLQYLQLQSQMQHENRSYTAVSNIMKTKHDTVKNSISNVR